MRVLFVLPKRFHFDKNLLAKYTVWGETFDYVRRRCDVEAGLLDCDLGWVTQRHLIEQLVTRHHDVVVIWSASVADVPASLEVCQLVKELSPETKVMVYGDGPIYAAKLFRHAGFDAIFSGGDPELAISSYLRHVSNPSSRGGAGRRVANVELLVDGQYVAPGPPEITPPDQWGFPPIDALPIDEYQAYYRNKYSHEKRLYPADVLSVTVSRGCTYRCHYCPTPLREGRNDRRRPVDQLVVWLEGVAGRFSQVHLSSPIFTGDPLWVHEFCRALLDRGIQLQWRTTVRVDQLDEPLVKLMAEAGCKTLLFGVETLYSERPEAAEKADVGQLAAASALLRRYGVRGKAFVMLGMPGQLRADILHTIATLRSMDLVVRPSGYTPLHHLHKMTVEELLQADLEQYDKKSFYNPAMGLSKREFFQLLLRNDPEER
ncbi:hypothetical protein BE17_19970 [Sorangium cellulosum]|uniref:Radical SAM core domain-containing protein n=1 Tax=Sorangium cellulosum TaxID=56 RepID=A0A150SMF7_SORCE|nr:hypothetical protein BE17_19970 [Sorangium cellulosum]